METYWLIRAATAHNVSLAMMVIGGIIGISMLPLISDELKLAKTVAIICGILFVISLIGFVLTPSFDEIPIYK